MVPNPALQSAQDATLLEAGKPVQRDMKAGETHAYRLVLAGGQFLHAVVDQRGIDVVVTLFGPDGERITQVDSPNGIVGPEPVWVIAKQPGTYRLEVRSLDPKAKPGRYEARIEELRAVAAGDRERVDCERASLEAESLLGQGDGASLQKAIAKYGEALRLRRMSGDHLGEASTLNRIGQIYFSLGDRPKALAAFEEGLPIARSLADRSIEAATLGNIGAVHYSVGDKKEALKWFKGALGISRGLPDRQVVAAQLMNIAQIYDPVVQTDKALESLNEALEIGRSLPNRQTEAQALINIGTVYYFVGKMPEALEYYGPALSVFQSITDRSGEATALNNIGAVYQAMGDMQQELGYIDQALLILRDIANPSVLGAALNNKGEVYYSLGDTQKALDCYNEALSLKRAVQDRAGEAVTLNNLGLLNGDAVGDLPEALKFFNRALEISHDLGDLLGEARALHFLGQTYDSKSEPGKALEYFDRALKVRREIHDRWGEALTLFLLGTVHYSMRGVRENETREAAALYNQALSVARDVGDRRVEAFSLAGLGTISYDSGAKERALDQFEQAIAILESLEATATIEEIKTGLSDERARVYQLAIRLLVQLGKPSDAFNLSERARARTFLYQIANVHPHQLNTQNTRLLLNERTLALELSALEQNLRHERDNPASSTASSTENDVVLSIQHRLATKQRQYEDLLLTIKLTNPEYASLRRVDTLTLANVQKYLTRDQTLVSYFVTREATLAFVIARNSFRAVEIPVRAVELSQLVGSFRRFPDPRLSNPYPESLKQLYRWLIAPVRPYIKTSEVGLILHGILHELPFAALTDGRHYFGDQHTLFHIPSASLLPFIRNKSKPAGRHMLALAQSHADGLPELRSADDEVKAVAALYNAQALISSNASKQAFLKQLERLGDGGIIHLAAHGELNGVSPLFSRIVLGADRSDKGSGDALELREVYDLDLTKTSLVVLSACKSQMGSRSSGDDIVSLNRAFIYAGAPSVIASLWIVDDNSTSLLMKSFYTNLSKGTSKAKALQAAQSDTRKRYRDPYYWAGFVLTGDDGRGVPATKK
jgi:CHAT domain-containing protein/predicted negative regulator of RcsB-dependent stress response